MTHKIILVGNPNTGKTTLYNTMTGSSEKASNWHGVTVGTKTRKYNFKGDEFFVTDIPGIYSLDAYSEEEQIAIHYLNSHKNDLIINICDANNLKRNLFLTSQLINRGFKIIVVVNMNNETQSCDYEKLERLLGVKIIPIDARKKDDITKVNNIIKNYAQNYKTQIISKTSVNYDVLAQNNDIFYKKDNYSTNDKIDKFILNKAIFIPLFLITILGIFYITFGHIGTFVTDIINILFNKSADLVNFSVNSLNLSPFIKDFVNFAVVDGLFSILSFLPQIIMLMFFLNLIEDIGLMSRFVFMFDGFFKKIGLSGRSIFNLFMGFGCSTSAIISTRNLENKNLKKRTVSLISFIPCSAKLPIFLVISSLFFEKYKFIFVFLIYIFSIFFVIFFAFLTRKNNQKQVNLIVEMPKYRIPNLRKITLDTIAVIKDFLAKTTKIILFFTIIVWILRNLSTRLIYLSGQNFKASLLYFIASRLSFIFAPIGLDNVGIVVSLLLGLCAKELIVVGLFIINGVSDLAGLSASLLSTQSVCYFSSRSAIVFMVFIFFYSPCISAVAAVRNEVGGRFALKTIFNQTVLAYIMSYIVNLILLGGIINYLTLLILLVALWGLFMLKSKSKKIRFCGDCYACKNF